MSTTYFTTLVNAGPGAQLLHQAGDPPCLIYNASELVDVYLSDSQSFTPGNADTNILRPLGTICPTGETDTWAMTLTGQSATVEISPAIATTPAPSDIANQIALAGITSQAPIYIEKIGTFAANTAWGPFTIPMSYSGRYLLYVTPDSSGDIFATDIQIEQLDSQGNPVFIEEFTVFNYFDFGSVIPILIQGNVLGASLKISGLTAASSWINGVTGASGLVASTATLNLAEIPIPLSASDPKIIGPYSGFGAPPTAYTDNATTFLGMMGPFAGRGNLILGANSGSGPGYIRLETFSVTGGTSPGSQVRIALPTNSSNTQSETSINDIAIPPYAVALSIVLTTATAATVGISILPYTYV